MSITLVQSKSATATGTSVSFTFDSPVTLGNRIVLIAAISCTDEATGSVAPDSLGHVFHNDFSTSVGKGVAGSGDNKLLEMYSAVIDAAGTCTIEYASSASATLLVVAQEWFGLFPGIAYGGGPGAGFIDHGQGLGAGTPPPLTLNFATDYPSLANYYGTRLPLVAVSAGFNSSLLTTNTEVFPDADRSVTTTFPTVGLLDTAIFIVVLYVGPVTPPDIRCGSPPTGTVGFPYSHLFPTSGGTAPYVYVVTAGSLPPGLSLNSGTGRVTGVPTTQGTYAFTISLTDAQGITITLACSITINALVINQTVILDLWVWRELFRFDTLQQVVNFPPGYAKALLYALCVEMHLEYPEAARKYDFEELMAEAQDALNDLEILNASDAVAMEPPV